MASVSSAMANGSDGGGCGLLFLAGAASCTFWFPLFLNHSISTHAVVHRSVVCLRPRGLHSGWRVGVETLCGQHQITLAFHPSPPRSLPSPPHATPCDRQTASAAGFVVHLQDTPCSETVHSSQSSHSWSPLASHAVAPSAVGVSARRV